MNGYDNYHVVYSSQALRVDGGAECAGCVPLRVAVEVTLTTPGDPDASEIPGMVVVTSRAPLSWSDEDEARVLNLGLDRLEELARSEWFEGLDADASAALGEAVAAAYMEELRPALAAGALLRVRPWSVSGEDAIVTPRAAGVDGEGSLVLELVSDLVDDGADPATVLTSELDGLNRLSLKLAPWLLRAALRHELERGAIPRRFDAEGLPSPTGPIELAVEDIAIEAVPLVEGLLVRSLRLDLALAEAGEPACAVDSFVSIIKPVGGGPADEPAEMLVVFDSEALDEWFAALRPSFPSDAWASAYAAAVESTAAWLSELHVAPSAGAIVSASGEDLVPKERVDILESDDGLRIEWIDYTWEPETLP
ncbi:MAG: hypothetical protein H6713_24365 [Myxococcales bacterium]|nr:hypothetical protein [Myxococcales bacterium]